LGGAHLALGPLLTLLVFKSGKPSLKFDLSGIVLLQLGALLYGGTLIDQHRPARRSPKWSTGMKTEAEIRAAGMRALIQALGTVEAEQFVAALTRDRFDYTEWRKTGLPDLDLETLSAQAAQYSRTLDN
jgi:hypothetical protein